MKAMVAVAKLVIKLHFCLLKAAAVVFFNNAYIPPAYLFECCDARKQAGMGNGGMDWSSVHHSHVPFWCNYRVIR